MVAMRCSLLQWRSVLLLLFVSSALGTSGKHGVQAHQNSQWLKRGYHVHRRHERLVSSPVALKETDRRQDDSLVKREIRCQFPTDVGLVPVTPNAQNAGWAMSPDQPCQPGHYCPYACPSGQVMAQWDPKATTYSYPISMNGGLYCDRNGSIQKPFPNKPYCEDGTGTVEAVNEASGNVAFCQTVLPGNEAMLIPTNVQTSTTLAVPGPDYWLSTSAHYFINPPGTSLADACVWGSSEKSIGNWAPYVGGANTDANGNTWAMFGWNPVYLERATPFHNEVPNWGVRLECEGDGCNGLPCGIDPSVHKVNECAGCNTLGAGGANFCVVSVPKGSKARFVIFDRAGESGSPASSSLPFEIKTASSAKGSSPGETSSLASESASLLIAATLSSSADALISSTFPTLSAGNNSRVGEATLISKPTSSRVQGAQSPSAQKDPPITAQRSNSRPTVLASAGFPSFTHAGPWRNSSRSIPQPQPYTYASDIPDELTTTEISTSTLTLTTTVTPDEPATREANDLQAFPASLNAPLTTPSLSSPAGTADNRAGSLSGASSTSSSVLGTSSAVNRSTAVASTSTGPSPVTSIATSSIISTISIVSVYSSSSVTTQIEMSSSHPPSASEGSESSTTTTNESITSGLSDQITVSATGAGRDGGLPFTAASSRPSATSTSSILVLSSSVVRLATDPTTASPETVSASTSVLSSSALPTSRPTSLSAQSPGTDSVASQDTYISRTKIFTFAPSATPAIPSLTTSSVPAGPQPVEPPPEAKTSNGASNNDLNRSGSGGLPNLGPIAAIATTSAKIGSDTSTPTSQSSSTGVKSGLGTNKEPQVQPKEALPAFNGSLPEKKLAPLFTPSDSNLLSHSSVTPAGKSVDGSTSTGSSVAVPTSSHEAGLVDPYLGSALRGSHVSLLSVYICMSMGYIVVALLG